MQSTIRSKCFRFLDAGGSLVLPTLTANLSTVNGAAFITNPLTDLRPYLGYKATLTAGGKTLVGWIKAAGTGETYGTELLGTVAADRDFSSDTGWWSKTGSFSIGSNVASYNGTGDYLYRLGVTSIGFLYKNNVTINVITGGVTVEFGAGADYYRGTSAVHTVYGTAVTDASPFSFISTLQGTIDNVSLKQVLTPSAIGVTIVSTQGGTTQNWASNDGIDANAGSFVLTITKA